MPSYDRTQVKDFNKALINQELQVVEGSLAITLKGFDKISQRLSRPAAGIKKIGQNVSNGVRTEFFADPGEVTIKSAVALSVGQEAAMDAALVSHVATGTSDNQNLENQDEWDMDILHTNFTEWNMMNNDDKFDAIRRLLRVVLRRFRGSAI